MPEAEEEGSGRYNTPLEQQQKIQQAGLGTKIGFVEGAILLGH